MPNPITQRRSGVLLHITSLPGQYGCGAFGKEARAFGDFLRASGFTCWQVLPLCMPDGYHSPYSSVGAFSGDYRMIDIEQLADAGLLSSRELREAESEKRYTVDFDFLDRTRFPLLRRAALRFRDRDAVFRFTEKNPEIAIFCRYAALRDDYPHLSLSELREKTADDEKYYIHAFIQYTFFRQWESLRSDLREKGIRVIGDIPIYVSAESADVFAHPELFDLKKDLTPAFVAGVPPDDFAADGQKWGNPLYKWSEMRKDSYAWWRARVAHNATLFDGLRLDHFRGFSSYYAIPAADKTAKNGVWRRGPGRPLIRALRESAKDGFFIAEDLGHITEDVEKLLKYSGFAGTRVFQFAFGGDIRHRPHAYDRNVVAYTGTHDNNTLLGWLLEAEPTFRRHVFDYCGYSGDRAEEACGYIRKALLASVADTVIFPMQDLLAYGADTRMNTPGTSENNWRYRVTETQIRALDTEKFRKENLLYDRIPED